MAGQMLVQMGLLVLVGFALGRVLLRTYGALAARFAPFRWALLISATFTLALWRLPRLLDLAVEDPAVEVIKALTLTFLAGLPLCLAWQAFGPVMHGVIHVEAVATLFRLAWLYLDSPVRLCAQYRYDEQTLLGGYLIALGSAYVIWLGARALLGGFRSS